ncbi:MAG: hypothetical protein PHI15_10245 [Methanomicrobium sp.]|nr:hypothetical protein [Methanomicrobium sp.]
MVTVSDYAIRETKDGRTFIALILQGGLCMVQSKQTGNFYATVKRCSIPSTFDEATAKRMIGETIPGSVQKTKCDPYEYTVQDTGEILHLDYRWAYVAEGATIEEAVFEGEPDVTMAKAKKSLLFTKSL